MKKYHFSVAILPEYPLSLMQGGLEVQCIKTKQSLLDKNINIKDFSFWDTSVDYDILHIFGNPAYLSDIIGLAKKKSKIVISTIMGYQERDKIKYLLSSIFRHIPIHTDAKRMIQMFQDADALITVNEAEQKSLVENFRCDPKKIQIIPNGVDKRFFNAAPFEFEKKYNVSNFCLCVGSICERKNQLNLAQALIKLNFPGVFIGNALPQKENYLNKFKTLISKSDLLHWIPNIEHNDPLLPSAYAASKLVCLPSFVETQSLAALEACAAGKPLILADIPSAYQKPFINALKCKPHKIDDIAEKISMAIKNPEKFVNNISDDYTWDKIADRIIKIYSKLL